MLPNSSSSSSATPKKKRSFKSGNAMTLLFVVVILGASGVAFFFYRKYQQIKKNPNIVAQQEVNYLVERVGKLIDLPKDETPTVATIQDKEKLKDQPFFANAQNGDKILIYTKARKAIIFREKDNRLINVGPIAIDSKNQVGIAMLNAGGNVDDAEKKLNNKYNGAVSVVSKNNAKNKNSVSKTTVVDVTGQNGELAKQIADELGGAVGELPQGEQKPDNAAIVIIVK